MTEEKEIKKKSKGIISFSLKAFGATGIAGLIGVLSPIFVTTDTFSSWKDNVYRAEQTRHSSGISANTARIESLHSKIDSQLIMMRSIEANQRAILNTILVE
jgi:hypothetical protein